MGKALTALSMRLFSSSDKRCLQKVRSQHLVQVNLVAGRRGGVVGERGDDFSSSTWGLEILFFLSRRINDNGN